MSQASGPPADSAPLEGATLKGAALAGAAAYALDLSRVRSAFDRAAATYDAAAVLQAQVRVDLLARLDLTTLTPRVVLDVGAGTGHAARALRLRYPKASVIALDSSPGMLQAAARQQTWRRPFSRVCADAGSLPFADGSVELILSNLMLQWCNPDSVFAECRRVLAPHGLLSFTTLGPDTLWELRAAWDQVDAGIHVHQFIDMHDIGDALVRAGFASPVLDVEHYTLNYLDLRRVHADLKATGARNAALCRPKGLTSRRKLARLQMGYEPFRRDGRLPATYEVVFAHAWIPEGARGPPGDCSTVSLEEIKRRLRARRDS